VKWSPVRSSTEQLETIVSFECAILLNDDHSISRFVVAHSITSVVRITHVIVIYSPWFRQTVPGRRGSTKPLWRGHRFAFAVYSVFISLTTRFISDKLCDLHRVEQARLRVLRRWLLQPDTQEQEIFELLRCSSFTGTN